MVYIVGLIGFIGGFACGLYIIAGLLKNVSRDKLLNDKSIKWKYGILTWLCAALGSYSFVKCYEYYF